MTTTLDIVDILWARADSSSLKTEISGSICKHRRDGNSNLEDIVINTIYADNQQVQRGIANVNIHVPDLTVNVNGVTEKQPDHARLKELAAIAVDLLSDVWGDNLNYDVQQQLLFEDREAGDHYINIRIEFFIENL